MIEGLQVTVTFRLKKENTVIYTVTLVNTKHCGEEKIFRNPTVGFNAVSVLKRMKNWYHCLRIFVQR